MVFRAGMKMTMMRKIDAMTNHLTAIKTKGYCDVRRRLPTRAGKLAILAGALLASVSATKVAAYNLTIAAANPTLNAPVGVVNVQPGNAVWSSATATVLPYSSGQTIVLLGSAPKGCSFNLWHENDGTTYYFGTNLFDNPLTVTMNTDRDLYADFQTNTSGFFNLILYKGVPGLVNGAVAGPANFFCAANVNVTNQSFPSGASVTLTNHPAAGWSFACWETNGVIVSNSAPLTVVMDREQLVQAVFVQNPLPPMVNITTPAGSATNWACHQFYIAATATAQGGMITNLEFFLGSTNGTLLAARRIVAAFVAEAVPWTTTVPGVVNTFVVRATDNYGTQTVSSPVSITTVLPPFNQLVLGITNIQCALCLSDAVGHAYALLATTNLAKPMSQWTNLGNLQGSNGYSTYLDPAFTNLPFRFYRAQQQ